MFDTCHQWGERVLTRVLALRVDVDTRRGLDEGVPRLLELFRRLGVRASFFVTMGPDHSGLALRRAWRPSFLLKMWRTRAWRLYGLGTLLSGTLRRPRLVGAEAPELLRQIASEGHEVAPHGWDHVGWQDRVDRWQPDGVRTELRHAVEAIRRALGTAAQASAAPGWRATPMALLVQEEFGFRYASDTRGPEIFRPTVDGIALKTLQVPTTMPTMDELIGRVADAPGTLADCLGPGLNVFTLHAEVEGGQFLAPFASFLDSARCRAYRVVRILEAVEGALESGSEIPLARVERGRVPGRSGWVSIPAGREDA